MMYIGIYVCIFIITSLNIY